MDGQSDRRFDRRRLGAGRERGPFRIEEAASRDARPRWRCDLFSQIQQRLAAVFPNSAQSQQVLDTLAAQVVQWVQQLPGIVLSFLGSLLVIVFLSLYLLIASPHLHRLLVSLFPPVRQRRASLLLCRTAEAMGGYFRGAAIDAASLAR